MTSDRPTSLSPQSAAPTIPSAARRSPTIAIWVVSLTVLAVGGALASLFVMMPVSLDPGEVIAFGADPWLDAAYAALAYCALFGASALALMLWHFSRGRTGRRVAAWTITIAEAALVAVGGAMVLRDWF